MIDLESVAKDVVADCLPQDGKLDVDQIEDDISEYVDSATDSVCTYYSQCDEIIRRYESDPSADTESADDMGQTFKPSEYQEAMVAYAYWIAHGVIDSNAREIIGEIREATEELESELAAFDIDASEYRISRDCPHGWAAHDRENGNGVCYWISGQLDGCNSLAVPVAGMWISYTWTPVSVQSECAI
jgi:hypothetical protein